MLANYCCGELIVRLCFECHLSMFVFAIKKVYVFITEAGLIICFAMFWTSRTLNSCCRERCGHHGFVFLHNCVVFYIGNFVLL